MLKAQKVVTTIASAAALASGLIFGFAPLANAQLDASSLGMQYPAAIGIASTDIRITIASIIRTAMGLLGIIAVVIILIGGFTWMTAGGNDEKVGEAKKWIFAGIIGLAIILASYALASFVITQLLSATNNAQNLAPV